MKNVLSLLAGALMVVGLQAGGQALKSGPQVGERLPGPFHPFNVTGEYAGERHCLYCQHGPNPVAAIFARDVSPGLVQLIKKIDAETIKHKNKDMGSYVVFLSDKKELAGKLKTLAEKENLKSIVLSIEEPAGPGGYKIAQDADVTVLLYNEATVVANHAFRKGELSEKAIGGVVTDVAKIVK